MKNVTQNFFFILKLLVICMSVLLSFSFSYAKDEVKLGLPLTCDWRQDCWIVNFVDLDSTPARKNYFCEHHTYDGHRGTDFAIRDMVEMGRGITVKAASGGVVSSIRDGMPDINVRIVGKEAVKGRECGNGVVIEHGEGWETKYCHLRYGSILVEAGQIVKKGESIGFVGQSGFTEFPHLHFSVKHNGRTIDPFTNLSPSSDVGHCTDNLPITVVNSLWDDDISFFKVQDPTAITNLGFSHVAPTPSATRAGLYKNIVVNPNAPILALWADILWVEQGDIISLQILKPNGKYLLKREVVQNQKKARRWIFAGKKLKGSRWERGTYIGRISLTRNANSANPKILSLDVRIKMP